MFKFKPYKEKYFNILALIDEVAVMLNTGLCANFIYYNSTMTRTIMTVISFAWGAVVEIVIILNIVILYVYYFKKRPIEFEYAMEVMDGKTPEVKKPDTKPEPAKKKLDKPAETERAKLKDPDADDVNIFEPDRKPTTTKVDPKKPAKTPTKSALKKPEPKPKKPAKPKKEKPKRKPSRK